MVRRRLVLWIVFGIMFVVIGTPVALWLAARAWPKHVGPWLPLAPAMQMATWGPAERQAAEWSLYAYANTEPRRQYAVTVLARELQRNKAQQLWVLGLMDLQEFGTSEFFTGACSEQVYRLTQAADAEVCAAARNLWLGHGSYPRFLKRTFAGKSIPQGMAAPDEWDPGVEGAHAVALLARGHEGFDHLVPSRYKPFCSDRIRVLTGAMRPDGRFSDDLRTQAICLEALAELYAMTNDAALLPVIAQASSQWHEVAFRERLSTLWMEDTTTAYLVAACGRALLAMEGNEEVWENMQMLASSFDTWIASGTTAMPPAWRKQGRELSVAEGERWAVMLVGARILKRDHLFPEDPPTALVGMTSWSPLGGYLSTLALGYGYRGDRITYSAWFEAFQRRLGSLYGGNIITSDHQGMEGGWTAHAPYGDIWESLFRGMPFSGPF